MTKTIKITKGLDIPLRGEAEKKLKQPTSLGFALKPTDFTGVFPKLLVKEGDEVKAGSPVFFDKYQEKVVFTSPVGGTIAEIRRGDKRLLLEVCIEAGQNQGFIDFGKGNPDEMTREQVKEKMLESGVWPMIRQRPYSVIANPNQAPKAIHIPAFDTAPLAPDYDFIVQGNGQAFQTGIYALAKLTDGTIHLNVHAQKTKSEIFLNVQKAQINTFSGPHPSGNVSVHIHHTDPINKGDVVWYLYPQDVITIGNLFLKGRYDASLKVAIAGSDAKDPAYFQTLRGAQIRSLVGSKTVGENTRIISGNVLTGKRIKADGYLGFYDSLATLIPEGNYHEFLGWAKPGFGTFSFSRTFFSWLAGRSKKYLFDTNYHGGERAFVMTGEFEKIMPLDLLPLQLIKACIIEDIDLMEGLGIYEVDEEDFALCEYIDTSKTEIQAIIRKGLDLMRKEMS